MTSSQMGRRYIEEARGRIELVRVAAQRELWATVVREAQESVELFLKGALRLMAVEPSHTHDVGDALRRLRERFPVWFQSAIDHLASISSEMAGDRGIAYYGDERQQIAPQDLFDREDAERALGNLEFVAQQCDRLLRDAEASAQSHKPPKP